jgi:hypothetical protein
MLRTFEKLVLINDLYGLNKNKHDFIHYRMIISVGLIKFGALKIKHLWSLIN